MLSYTFGTVIVFFAVPLAIPIGLSSEAQVVIARHNRQSRLRILPPPPWPLAPQQELVHVAVCPAHGDLGHLVLLPERDVRRRR